MDSSELLEFDRKLVWHPYTSATEPLHVYPVESASGCIIRLTDGRELVDGMSSWWAAIHGYNHPLLNAAIEDQLRKMAHIMFGGFTHEPAVKLAKTLVDIVPAGLCKVFFCDSGSVSVEIAMKMALQYWIAKGKSEKCKFATIKSGYHGDTWNAMSVCDPDTGMHHIFHKSLPVQFFAERPKTRFGEDFNTNGIDSISSILRDNHQSIAAIILEPIMQGAGGMWFYSPEYLKQVHALCREYDILLICDEIATGFGRTGKLFACEHAGITPDIMCLGKAITGGYVSFAATLTTELVAKTISDGNPGVFMHGPTFMGNPLACAVANASIELLLNSDWEKNISSIEKQLSFGLESCSQLPGVIDVRVLGACGVVELAYAPDIEKIQKLFVEKGVWVRPFGKLVYLIPPFVISKEELHKLTGAVHDVIKEIAGK